MKQNSAQYGHGNYGAGDRAKKAKPVGYRYMRIRDKNTGRLRSVTKDDKEYYLTPTKKLINDYEAGDKSARRMIYFENRKDHSDKSLSGRSFEEGGSMSSDSYSCAFGKSNYHMDKQPLKSLNKFAKGGNVTIGEHKAKYRVKYKLNDDDKSQLGYLVQILQPDGNGIDHYLLYDNSKTLVKELRLQEAHEMVKNEKIIQVKSYDISTQENKHVKRDIPVKDMGYTEAREWIKDNIIPELKSAVCNWNSYNGGSFNVNDEKSKKKYIDEVRKSADYVDGNELAQQTSYVVSDNGMTLETDDGDELNEVLSDNTYNWSYLGLCDWNFRIYETDDDRYLLLANPHLTGDIRGNYGDAMIFEDDSQEEVLFKFREAAIDGNREIRLQFKDKTEVLFSAQQDSDVNYYELQEVSGSKKIKLNTPSELLITAFKSFGGWKGDDFIETIVDEFISAKSKKELGGKLDSREGIGEMPEDWDDNDDENDYDSDEDENDLEFSRGGSMKRKVKKSRIISQKSEQYKDRDVEKYGSRDGSVQARPVGYRYKRIRDKVSGRLRAVTKDDKEYYNPVTQKDIKSYEAGDKLARRMIYFENRKDHSDRNPHTTKGV